MALHLKSDAAAMSEINVTPLVDVMLVLLVIFIVTAPLLTRAVRIDLPKTSAVAPVAQTKHIHVSLDASGTAYVEQRPLPLAQVENQLRNALRENRDLAVQVFADQKAVYGQVAQLMAQIRRAGVTKIALVTLPQ